MFVNSFIKRHWRILIVEAILIGITLVSVIALNLEAKKLYIAIVFDKSTSRQTVKNALEVYKKRMERGM